MAEESKPKTARKPRGVSLLLEVESDDEAIKKAAAHQRDHGP
jgi:hypothetical protein